MKYERWTLVGLVCVHFVVSIFNKAKKLKKLESDATEVPKQAKANYNFN